jgi:hypothetical protein
MCDTVAQREPSHVAISRIDNAPATHHIRRIPTTGECGQSEWGRYTRAGVDWGVSSPWSTAGASVSSSKRTIGAGVVSVDAKGVDGSDCFDTSQILDALNMFVGKPA